MQRIALTLPGGGARAAYQAGVLRAISDILQVKSSPFSIVSGISAGAINGVWIGAGAADFDQSTLKLCEMWKSLSVKDVYKTDPLSLLQTGTSLLTKLSFGNWVSTQAVTYLLDTSPLAELLRARLDFKTLQKNLSAGLIEAISVSASDYHSGNGVTFFEGAESLRAWHHTLSRGQRTRLTVEHVLASAAIPVFFPPVRIEGRDYGDGGIGVKYPLSPAIHLGATKMLVIGVQNPQLSEDEKDTSAHKRATLGDISGALLNALFLNSLDADIDRLTKINHSVARLTKAEVAADPEAAREVPLLVIRPSRDLSCLGVKEFGHFPFTIRHLLKGLGIDDRKGWDLLSYLAFDQIYSEALLELGHSDTMAIKKEILQFFKD